MPRHLLLSHPKSSIFSGLRPPLPSHGRPTSGPPSPPVASSPDTPPSPPAIICVRLATSSLADRVGVGVSSRGRHGSGEAERLQGCRAKSITAQTTARACRPPPQACTTRSRRASIRRRIHKFRMLHAASGISFRLDSSCVYVSHELSAPPAIIQIFSAR
jgi:hypothetical protein